jgi:hypothetical protein
MAGSFVTYKKFDRLSCQSSGTLYVTQNFDLFSKYLEPLIINYLKDRVSAIRAAAIDRIP